MPLIIKFSKKLTTSGIRVDLIQYFLKTVQLMLMCNMLKTLEHEIFSNVWLRKLHLE